MFDWIPIQLYTPINYYISLVVVLFVVCNTHINTITGKKSIHFMNTIGYFCLVFFLLYMGTRPIHGVFIDMTTYNRMFERYQSGGELKVDSDLLFHLFVKFCSSITTAKVFFFLCTLLYIIPLFIVCKKWFKRGWFYAFLMLYISFTFWAYGTNGIRNGIAGSLFLLGISRDKRIWQITWIIIAINFHQSMLLPTFAFVLANFINKPKLMITFWTLCIPLSLIGGGVWESFFASLGFGDDRLDYLTNEQATGRFSSSGFRWDFLLFSASAVFAGWYYIFKCKYEDKVYFWIFNTYILSNAFWILVIRANFSNRFAYLSWFMMALVIIYPLLKHYIVPSQHKVIGYIIFGYFSFTFLMNIILS